MNKQKEILLLHHHFQDGSNECLQIFEKNPVNAYGEPINGQVIWFVRIREVE